MVGDIVSVPKPRGEDDRLGTRHTVQPLDVDAVRRTLDAIHTQFYAVALGGRALDSTAVPFLVVRPHGTTDLFASEIDYTRYPVMFHDVFPEVSNEDLADLCIVAQLLAEALVQLDKVIDHQLLAGSELVDAIALLGSQYKLSQALRTLHRFVDGGNFLWDRFDRLHGDYVAQIVKEKLGESLECPSIAEMEQSAVGKVALAKIITAVMANLSGRTDILTAIETSQDLYAVGYQLYDDVKDWRADYGSGHYSYPLTRGMRELGFADVARENRPSSEMFGRCLHASNILGETLELSADYLRRAREAVVGLPCRAWISWIATMQEKVLGLRDDMLVLRRRAFERARVRTSPKRISPTAYGSPFEHMTDAIQCGIAFLQNQQRNGYLEAGHLEMTPPNETRPAGCSACHWGTVFQRALVLHALACGRNVSASFSFDETVFQRDLQELIDARVRNGRGGWRYFPDMSLPPDCDDLGEVLHVLVEAHDPRVRELCHGPILLALENQDGDGGIDTWISDPDDPFSERATVDVHATWGHGRDVEVMANFLHGIWLYSRNEFATALTRGLAFIADRQSADGSWASTWYVGPYYGTWACCRLLHAAGRHGEHLRRGETFLLDSQHAGGGWGASENVVDTAFTLMAVAARAGYRSTRVEAAIRLLLDTQRRNGSWESSPFIKMETVARKLRPMAGFQQELYTSDTLATAAAVRALVAVNCC